MTLTADARETIRTFFSVETSGRCAGVAFFTFIAIFPILVFAVSLASLVGGPSFLGRAAESLSFVAPDPALTLLSSRLDALLPRTSEKLSLGLFASAIAALWSGSRAVSGLFNSLSVAYDGPPRRGFFKRWFVAGTFMAAGGIFLLLGLWVIAATPRVAEFLSLPEYVLLARWPALSATAFAVLCALYRWGPEQHATTLKAVYPGAALGALIWVILSFVFSLYTERMERLEYTFGSVSSTVVLLLWLYFSARACVLGAMVNVWLRSGQAPKGTFPQ